MHLIPFDTIWFYQGEKTPRHKRHCGLTSHIVTMVSSYGRVMIESVKSLILVHPFQKGIWGSTSVRISEVETELKAECESMHCFEFSSLSL